MRNNGAQELLVRYLSILILVRQVHEIFQIFVGHVDILLFHHLFETYGDLITTQRAILVNVHVEENALILLSRFQRNLVRRDKVHHCIFHLITTRQLLDILKRTHTDFPLFTARAGLLEPRVLQRLGSAETLLGVALQSILQEVDTVLGNVLEILAGNLQLRHL